MLPYKQYNMKGAHPMAFKYIIRDRNHAFQADLSAVSEKAAKQARKFHSSFPGYAPTPLAELKNAAAKLGVGGIWVKDESFRFGLNAFKVLGGGFAIGNYMAKQLGTDVDSVSYDALTSAETRAKLGDVTFITATDGNHGRGVAWMASKLQQNCVVYMPKGTAAERLENIRTLGADASIRELNYDECVFLAHEHAEKNGWVLTQDTAWEGYTDIPSDIMQGYTTIADEISEQISEIPTHIILQAGVGSFASAILGYFAAKYGENRPKCIILEPNAADCIYRSVEANDGKIRIVEGDMPTIMAGLACGQPSTISYDIIRAYADAYVSCPDHVSALGMRMLGNPIGDDQRIISGESGAAGMGLIYEIMKNPELAELKSALSFDESARILLISTEGDTDKENYRRIVWEGAYPLK